MQHFGIISSKIRGKVIYATDANSISIYTKHIINNIYLGTEAHFIEITVAINPSVHEM